MGCYRIRGDAGYSSTSEYGGDAEETEWEVRPCGMLVQKRILAPPTSATASECTSTTTGGSGWKKIVNKKKKKTKQEVIRVRVSYGGNHYDVPIHYQATFGDLKKLLSPETGLRPPDQRLAYKGKERRDTEYLDLCGVKEGSKVDLEEDACSKERKYVEMKKAARDQSIQKAVGDVAMEVERLADQVASIHTSVSRGARVAEAQITTLIEMLMRQAVTLDAIPLGDESTTTSQKHLQAKVIQKCVETLDALLLSNARINNTKPTFRHPVVVNTTTTNWESFNTSAAAAPAPPSHPAATTTTTIWEFFD